MDRITHNTPEKVLSFGLKRVIVEQEKMLDESTVKVNSLLREILRLECIEICRDKRITTLNNRLYVMGFKATNNTSPKKASDDELRVQVKRLTNQLRFHREKSAGRKRYIDAMREAGMGKGPLVRKERPRGNRVCSKCGEYGEHYKNCAYCIVCWRQYKPMKDAQKVYEIKREVQRRSEGRPKRLKPSGLVILKDSEPSGLKLVGE